MGDGKESLGYGGFMESFDAASHHVNAGAVRARLEGSIAQKTADPPESRYHACHGG